MTRRHPAPTLFDTVLAVLNQTPRRLPDGRPVNAQHWNRAVAAAVEAAAAEAGGVTIRPAADIPDPGVRERPADEWDLQVCARILGVDVRTVLSREADQVAAEARHIIGYVLHEATGTSYAAVGRLLGGSHGMVAYGCGQVARRLGRDPQFRARVRACTAAVVCRPEDGPAVAAVA